jgi:hypothetical protein
LLLAVAPAAQAVQFDVTRFDDPVTNGCNSGVDCSLREAVEDANATVAGDVISLPAPPAGQRYELTQGQLVVLESLTVTGAGASTTTIDGNSIDRIFMIGSFMPAAIEVEINGVTLTGGRSSPGGAIEQTAGTLVIRESVITGNVAISEGPGFGGGLAVLGQADASTRIEETTFSNNTAPSDGVSGGGGGAIYTAGGTMAIAKSTLGPGNAVPGLGSGGAGGAIMNEIGTVALLNSTVSGNSVTGGSNGGGGGIVTLGGQTTSLDSTTVFNNQVTNSGGVGGNLFNSSGNMPLRQTIVAGGSAPSGSNCSGSFVTQGHNLESPSSQCGLNGAGDLTSVADPLLGPLADNEGPTFTHALLDGSPAIDTGAADCPQPDTDQRDVVRAQGTTCDIGAYELLQGSQLVDPVQPPADLCFGERATIIGDKGDNVINGTPGDDVIVAKTGVDQVIAGEGDDLVCGRGTDDDIQGGPGDDRLRADGGNDKVKGGPGDDIVNGASNDDKVRGNGGDDKVHGGAGDDDLSGGKGDDECFGTAGRDRATGCEEKFRIP